MNKQHLNQLLMMAAAGYPDVLAVLVEMLRKYAAALGLMPLDCLNSWRFLTAWL